MTKIKFCGLSRRCDIDDVNKMKPDYIGFIFAPSKRQISLQQALTLKRQLSKEIQAVGVFVNENPRGVIDYWRRGAFDVIQLHGQEDESYIKLIKNEVNAPIIKAFSVNNVEDLNLALKSTADYILLDNKIPGSGDVFDHSILKNIEKNPRPFFLAGGLGVENIRQILESINPFAVDVSSGIETEGIKDFDKMKAFIHEIRT